MVTYRVVEDFDLQKGGSGIQFANMALRFYSTTCANVAWVTMLYSVTCAKVALVTRLYSMTCAHVALVTILYSMTCVHVALVTSTL